ncbi:chromate transporter [Paenibacillus sp. MBLB4367]|uniref:chromate transporter n=1 Tax=Paenibacillus sp. MBLB4367 TaxID=3384767 RepID=UPI0039082BD3
MLFQLFWTFFKVGLVSFGGGYAMIPIIENEVASHGWLTPERFAEVTTLAGMSPGPIAMNSAIYVGFQTSGLAGATAAALGIVLPSLIIVVAAAAFFYKAHQHKLVKSAFYGLRPIVTGLIVYAAIRFASVNGVFGGLNVHTAFTLGIFAFALYAIAKLRMHPVYVILLSGVAGAAVFG